MRQFLLYIFMLLCAPYFVAQAQDTSPEQKRLIYFTDKANSPYSLQQPLAYLSQKALDRRQRQSIALKERDLPVNPSYVTGLKAQGVKVWYTSRWFNAAVVQCSDEEIAALEALPYVRSSRTLNRIAVPTQGTLSAGQVETVAFLNTPEELYGLSFHQANMLGAIELHSAGFKGSGMTIAVLDAGFPGVNTISAFTHLFQQNKIKGTFDFVQKQENVYGANSHGTSVLSTMAAYDPGKIIGTAYEANYILLRTEDAATEHNIEEINWLLAAEYADSAGADVINSSLGYNTFDSPSTSYTYSEMDGNTSLVAKAADLAAQVGMLIITSAGNEGGSPWKYISSPADADSVLAVGAVDSLGVKATFSSFGPSADGQIKPDVVALGRLAYVLSAAGNLGKANGTSFSGPIVAGFAASLWQANPGKTNYEIIQMLRRSGSQAANPDNNIGYGIPSYSRVLSSPALFPTGDKVFITNPVTDKPIVLLLGQEWLKHSMDVQILNATGKLIMRQQIKQPAAEQKLKLEPHTLSSGLYLCRISSGSAAVTVRFIKL
ncbi:S8 family serine peptidase [Pontibacter cellulosilyticus]|uniref:S8 family serine peptidase n=1 Tax=Pontibacter cellulosilyticus TaxID=1720253 RepID=A0A923N2R6_9BACT|nr:S8 family serine peptidase [Pontibacter cellulosilyticus]MBC5991815.1 S8 family serine peptidase [Pontibacter cellulosilyticus]